MSTSELDAQAVPDPGTEPGGGPPETRGLTLVLRRLLSEGSGVSLMVGKVTATPDAKHVEVEIAGKRAVIAALANYVPVIGEGAWCLMGSSITLAIGSASGLRPTTIPSGTANNQVPVWNSTTGAWVPQARAPQATDADTLDGLDSAVFLQQVLGGTRRVWWTRYTGAAVSNRTSHAHTLGVVPVLVLTQSLLTGQLTPAVVESATATTIGLYWQSAAGAVDVYLLAIG